jgi:hypothetical protein
MITTSHAVSGSCEVFEGQISFCRSENGWRSAELGRSLLSFGARGSLGLHPGLDNDLDAGTRARVRMYPERGKVSVRENPHRLGLVCFWGVQQFQVGAKRLKLSAGAS